MDNKNYFIPPPIHELLPEAHWKCSKDQGAKEAILCTQFVDFGQRGSFDFNADL